MSRNHSVKQQFIKPGQPYAGCLRFSAGTPGRLIPALTRIRVSLCLRMLLSITLSTLLISTTARAGDEEFNPSAYQIFDPTTGYFIDVEPPPDQQATAATQTHAATVADPASAANQTGQQPSTTNTPVDATLQTATVPPATAESSHLPLLIGAGVLVLAGIVVVRKRKRIQE
jgi:LPXTG-motif cell wall-anchored protein